MSCSQSEKIIEFSLENIASWQNEKLLKPEIIAGNPSLQRGAVWEAQQVEILWDSIFRGFPIGAIVLSKKIDKQKTKTSDLGGVLKGVTHHILDGQQRTNAIAWGYDDLDDYLPISKDKVQCLWVDLSPGRRLKTQGNSRKYLFRITTKAHPWGFRNDEKSSPLEIRKRLKFRLNEKFSYEAKYGHFPMDANFPIPLALIWQYFDKSTQKLDIKSLKNDSWYHSVQDLVTGELEPSKEDFRSLNTGLKNAINTVLLGLIVPQASITIEDIEQIFLRLNRQGTPLDNEELIYSMIKAYWPEVELIMVEIQDLQHAPEARMIAMGLRVALHDSESSENTKNPLPGKNIQQIREIFGHETKEKKRSLKREEDTIKNYFVNDFKKSLKWIDLNVLWSRDKRDGIPAYLRSSIAWHSKDIFTWLVWLAKEIDYRELKVDERKLVLAITTSIHWFAKDKKKVVNAMVRSGVDAIFSPEFNLMEIAKSEKNNAMYEILTPDELFIFMQLPKEKENVTEVQLKAWKSFWEGCVVVQETGKKFSEDKKNERLEKGLFLEKLKRENELLVYAQAEYISEKYGGFDPSNKLMWKGHNRPWDYDHILPSNRLSATGRGNVTRQFQNVCCAWQQSIGNLVAVDLSFNRSASDKVSPEEKYKNNSESSHRPDLHALFDNEKLKYFDIELGDTDNIEKTTQFILAIRDRFFQIYEHWFTKLKVDKILKISTN